MRYFIILCTFVVLSAISLSADEPAKRHTARFAGTYMFGSAIHKDADVKDDDYVGPGGTVLLYPESDSTMLFYMEVEKGEPANSIGRLTGKISLKSNKGIFTMNNSQGIPICKLSFQIEKRFLDIRTVDGLNDCGFGPGVRADNRFFRYSGEIPECYEVEGKKTCFEQTPEKKNGTVQITPEKKTVPSPVNGNQL
jgi:hypothetical protein